MCRRGANLPRRLTPRPRPGSRVGRRGGHARPENTLAVATFGGLGALGGRRGAAGAWDVIAKTGYSVTNAALFPALQARVMEEVDDCSPQHLTNILWAYGTMKKVLSQQVLDVMGQKIVELAATYDMSDVSNSLFVCVCGNGSAAWGASGESPHEG